MVVKWKFTLVSDLFFGEHVFQRVNMDDVRVRDYCKLIFVDCDPVVLVKSACLNDFTQKGYFLFIADVNHYYWTSAP